MRDYAEVRGTAASSRPRPPTPRWRCSGIDHAGLDPLDRELLDAICAKFGGGPVGLSTLAVAVGEEQDTIEDVYEPYLLQQGLIKRTPRGRCATAAAFAHLGLRGARRRRALLAPVSAHDAMERHERSQDLPHLGALGRRVAMLVAVLAALLAVAEVVAENRIAHVITAETRIADAHGAEELETVRASLAHEPARIKALKA